MENDVIPMVLEIVYSIYDYDRWAQLDTPVYLVQSFAVRTDIVIP